MMVVVVRPMKQAKKSELPSQGACKDAGSLDPADTRPKECLASDPIPHVPYILRSKCKRMNFGVTMCYKKTKTAKEMA